MTSALPKLCVAASSSRADLLAWLGAAQHAARQGAPLPTPPARGPLRLALTTHDAALAPCLAAAERAVKDGLAHDGVTFVTTPRGAEAVAALFPGQGSQSPRMLAGLRRAFPGFETALTELDGQARDVYGRSVLEVIDAPDEVNELQRDTYWAQAGLGLTCAALSLAFRRIGLATGLGAGHSYGELVALHHAGACDARTLFELTRERGRLMREAGSFAPGGMLAVAADEARTSRLLSESGSAAEIANLNGERQTVVAGAASELTRLERRCADQGVRTVRLKTACAFHSSAMAPAGAALRGVLEALVARGELSAPASPVLANATARAYPRTAAGVVPLLSEQLAARVRWRACCEELAAQGARVFLELGPGSVLTRTVRANLPGGAHAVLSCDPLEADARSHLLGLFATLFAHGALPSAEQLPADLLHATGALAVSSAPEPTAQGVHTVVDIHTTDGAVPSFLEGQSEVVRRYLELSARVLDGALARPELAREPGALTRIVELNAEVTSRFLALQSDALGWLVGTGGARAALEPAPRLPVVPAQAAAVPVAAAQSAPSTLAWLRGELSAITGFPAHALGDAVALADLGIDSLAQASLLERIVQRSPGARDRARALLSARTLAELAALVEGEPHEAPAAPAVHAEPWDVWLRASISSLTGFPHDRVRSELSFEELGIDSLALSSLLESAVKRSHAIKGRARELLGARTVADAVRVLSRVDEGDDQAAPAPRAADAHAPEQALRHALSARAGRPLDDAGDLERDAGLSPFAVRAALAEAADVEPLVALAGEELVRFTSLGDMAAYLAQLREIAPLADPLVRYELRERPAAWTRTELPHALFLLGRDGALLAQLHEACARAGSDALVVRTDARGFTFPDGAHVPLEATGELAARLDAGTLRPGVLFVAGARGDDGSALSEALDADVVALFALAKALEASAQRRHLAVVSLDGAQLSARGARGVARALAHEWRDSPLDVSALRVVGACDAGRLVERAFSSPPNVNIVLRDGDAHEERLLKRELAGADAGPVLARGDVVLLVGGAVGIGAELALGLAARYGCAIAAVGRTAYDGHCPFADVAEGDLGAAVHAALSRQGAEVSAEALRVELARVKRARAVHATAERLSALSVPFHYVQSDARDAAALGRAVTDVEARFGRIDVVIHAAGVAEDALLAGKSFASFRRVLGTKADSALALQRALKGRTPRKVVLLTSLVGHTGNAGQTDYCAANELLDALAQRWRAEVPYDVAATAWSVWDEVGLASRAVRERLTREGMHLITPAEGVARFVRELGDDVDAPWALFASPRGLALASGVAPRMEVPS